LLGAHHQDDLSGTRRSRWAGRLNHLRQIARSVAHDPREGVREAWEDLCRRWEDPAPGSEESPSPQWEQWLHQCLGAPWPCSEVAAAGAVWDDIQERLRESGLRSGRGAYGGWDDGDPALARAVWCLAAHLRPRHVVETGVARGITSRMVLERLQRNGEGALWSIDLPALSHREWSGELGVAVPAELRDRWTLIGGSSRQRLRGVLKRLGAIDLFVHDSLHSERNIRFELERAWPAVRSGGAVVVDDVHMNAAFHRWLARTPNARGIVCRADDGQALFAIAIRER
jgi:predicted O-methyltransferase YrrM